MFKLTLYILMQIYIFLATYQNRQYLNFGVPDELTSIYCNFAAGL
jgi:hypothetical protein